MGMTGITDLILVVALLAGLVAALHALWIAQRLTTWPDEIAHVVVGERLWRTRLSPFSAAFSGQRMPGPQYLFGATQLCGRSLLLARVVACVIAGLATGLGVALTGHLSGLGPAIVAALILCTSRTLLGYWACATYSGSNAALIFLGLWGHVLGLPWLLVLSGAGLFLSRVNLWPAFVVYAWWLREAPGPLFTLGLIPLVWFLADRRHLRILVYVDGLKWLGRWLGADSVFDHGARPPEASWRGWGRVVTLHRGWWLLAVPGLILMGPQIASSPLLLLFGVLLLTNAWRVRRHPRLLGPYLPCFMALLAPLIATGLAGEWMMLDAWPALGVLLGANLIQMQHPLWVAGRRPLREMKAAAEELRRILNLSGRLGLWGNPMPLYLAGLDLPLGQIQSVFTGSGVWPTVQQVVDGCSVFVLDCSRHETVTLQTWAHIATVAQYPPWTYAIYRRQPTPIVGREEF